ncbi:sulfite exporter TauE/SafE family protein [Pseudescherichia vulneris]
MVPVLHLLFPHCAVQVLVATSLMVVMLSALMNACAFWRQGVTLNLSLLALWSMGMAAGMQVGVYASFLLPDRIILLLFALVLVGLALRNLCQKAKTPETSSPDRRTRNTGLLLCTAGGAVAGLTGLGGGSVLAPLISQLSGIPRRHIAVYCNVMMVFGSVETVIGYLHRPLSETMQLPQGIQLGWINLTIVTVVFISALLFQPISMRLRSRLPEQALRHTFTGILLMIATLILVTL